MNLATILAASAEIGLMPKIIFWILLLLWGIGAFGFYNNPNVLRGTVLVQIILFGILGFFLFGF